MKERVYVVTKETATGILSQDEQEKINSNDEWV